MEWFTGLTDHSWANAQMGNAVRALDRPRGSRREVLVGESPTLSLLSGRVVEAFGLGA